MRPLRTALVLALLAPSTSCRSAPDEPGVEAEPEAGPHPRERVADLRRKLRPTTQERATLEGGRWRRVDVDDEVAALEALGYLDGTQPAPACTGVVRSVPERAQPGLNFVTSGHIAGAELTDEKGTVLHQWSLPFAQAFPDVKRDGELTTHWRRAKLLEGGDVVAIFEGHGVVRLDRDSKLRWVRPNHAHHDVIEGPNGHLHMLTRRYRRPGFRSSIRGRYIDDSVSVLTADGAPVRSISIGEAILAEPALHALWPDGPWAPNGDVFHTNSLQLLGPGQLGVHREGYLLSVRNLDLLLAIDVDGPRVSWWRHGGFSGQHDAELLASGTVLLFDNLGAGGRSRALELDPDSGGEGWQYADGPGQPLFSLMCGTVQRLPNGNTLIAETDPGRALEVTAAGEVVWEWVSPHRAGERDQFVASLFEVVRVPRDAVPWLGLPR